jgi:hypothetical protein
MSYTSVADFVFVILTLVSSLALLSKRGYIALIFFLVGIIFVSYEHEIMDYLSIK